MVTVTDINISIDNYRTYFSYNLSIGDTLITVCLVMILVGSYINHSVSCNDTGRFLH